MAAPGYDALLRTRDSLPVHITCRHCLASRRPQPTPLEEFLTLGQAKPPKSSRFQLMMESA